LSKRQAEVLVLVAQGHTDAAIARLLQRSPRTIRAHLHSAYAALGAVNRTHAVAIAAAWRLIELDTFLAKAV
jgi:DNA-binding CsgD family transcriptional regulator